MEIPQVFQALLEQGNKSLGEWLKANQEETGITAVKFVRVDEKRGKLVFVAKDWRINNPIDRTQIKKFAVRKLHEKLSPKLGKLSQEDLLYLIDCYEEISANLIADKNNQHITKVAFGRVLKTLSGRNFNPATLEFDLEKKAVEPRSFADNQIREKLEEYRLHAAESEYLSSSVEECELSVRAYLLLKNHDIQTFGELVYLKDLLRFGKLKGLGRKTQAELQEIIAQIEERSK